MTIVFTAPTGVDAPSYGSKHKSLHRKNVANFGDGYSQRARDGIKTKQKVWSLTWSGLQDADAKELIDFFDDRGEVEAFEWTDPDGDTKKYIATDAERSYDKYNNNNVNVTFSEDLNG